MTRSHSEIGEEISLDFDFLSSPPGTPQLPTRIMKAKTLEKRDVKSKLESQQRDRAYLRQDTPFELYLENRNVYCRLRFDNGDILRMLLWHIPVVERYSIIWCYLGEEQKKTLRNKELTNEIIRCMNSEDEQQREEDLQRVREVSTPCAELFEPSSRRKYGIGLTRSLELNKPELLGLLGRPKTPEKILEIYDDLLAYTQASFRIAELRYAIDLEKRTQEFFDT